MLQAFAALLLFAADVRAEQGTRPRINEITRVASGSELLAALKRGDAHIQITEHLDLTGVTTHIAYGAVNQELFWPKPSTRSIRVSTLLA